MPKLRLHSPASIPGLGSILVISGQDVTIGRASDNQLVIPESSVSPYHARLRCTGDNWLLTDLGQTNGIWVGVKRVTEHQLNPGQLFRIGGVALEFISDQDDSSRLAPRLAPASDFVAHDSWIRGSQPQDSKDPTMRDAGPPSRDLTPNVSQRISSKSSTGAAPGRYRLGSIVAWLLAMVVLGFAITFGGYFALRWMSRLQRDSRTSPPAASAQPLSTNARAPMVPEALLADKDVANLAEEQRVEVPNALSLVLPGNALHTPTHLIVARAASQGTPFCNATEFAGPVFEVATSSNSVWAQPATVEFNVDVDQLAKTHVSSLAIGLLDPAKQQWQLLPTVYDSTRRIARAEFWQPGLLALFFVRGVEFIATSEHFALLLEPDQNPSNSAKSHKDRSAKALGQLESALSHYRAAGYRVPSGSLWICASKSAISRARAELPLVHNSELGKSHSHALARAAFIALWPAYLNSHSVEGREFWFDAMLTAIAAHALGARVAGASPALKRLATSLLAEDGPTTPLFLSVIAHAIDQQVDLFRIWTDTIHVMNELDTKPNSEGQSRVLPIDMALEQATQKNLLAHYADAVRERLSNSLGAVLEAAPSEHCPSLTTIPIDAKQGAVQLDVPAQYTARWACLSLLVPTGKYRNIRLQLAGDVPPGLNLQLLRSGSGQPGEPMSSTAQRIDLENSETLIFVGVNSNMAQSSSVTLQYEDVSMEIAFDPASPITVRPGQIVSSNLQLTKIFPELKNIDVEWDYGDGSPKDHAHLTMGGVVRAEQPHAWTKSGNFSLRAAVSDADRPTREIGFAVRQITVQPVQIALVVKEPNPQAQSDVGFAIRSTGPVPDTAQFRLDFGDGSEPLLVSTPEATHRFTKPGEYAVSVELLAAQAQNEIIASSKTTLIVRAADTTAPVESPASSAAPSLSSASVQ